MTKALATCRALASSLCLALLLASVPQAAWAAASKNGDAPGGRQPAVPAIDGPIGSPSAILPSVPALPAAAVPGAALPVGVSAPTLPAVLEPTVPVPPAPASSRPDAAASAPAGRQPGVPALDGPIGSPRAAGRQPGVPALDGSIGSPRVDGNDAYASHLAALEAVGHIGNPSRIGRLFLEARASFDQRAPESVPEAAEHAPVSGDVRLSPSARPAQLGAAAGLVPESTGAAPPGPNRGPLKKAAAGLGTVAVLFIVAMVVQQTGIEALGATMPALLQKTFGDFSVVADITILASLGSILGRIVGPLVVDRFSLKKGYLGALALRVLLNSVLAVLLANGAMTVPVLGVFYAVSGVISGVSLTAEKAIPPAILGQSQEKLENFGAWKQVLLEIVASIGPIAIGALLGSMGFVPMLVSFPVAFALSILMLWKWLKVPDKLEAMRLAALAADRQKGGKGVGSVFADFFRKIARGARVVWSQPALRYSFLAFTAYMMLNPFLYTVLAPAYANRLLGADSPQMAAVYGMLTGLYSFGGLLGGLIMLAEQRRLKRAQTGEGGKSPVPPQEIAERLRKSMLRWMFLGTVGLLAIATLALPLPALGALVGLPGWLAWAGALTLPALALIPFGIAQVVANIKQENYFVSKLPEAEVNNAIGFLGAASLLISTMGLIALKFLFTGRLPFGWQPFAFSGLHGFTPFLALAVAMIPLAAYYVFLTRRLDKASKGAP